MSRLESPGAGSAGWRKRSLAVVLGLGLVVVLAYAAVELSLLSFEAGFPIDDSWIHLQFARNLAAGEGLAYNPGELVAGSSAPLWTALLSILFLLPGNIVVWTKLVGVALHLVVLHAAYRLGRELGLGEGAALLAATLVLTTDWMVWSALSGMEIPLFVLLSLWGMILQIRERTDAAHPPLALGILGLAALARPEGCLLLLLAVADRLLLFERDNGSLRWQSPSWRRLLQGLGLAALALVPTLLVYYAINGSVLPTTFGAKTADLHRLWPRPKYVYIVVGIFFRPQPVVTLLLGAGVLRLVEGLDRRRSPGLLPALWVIGLPLAYSVLTPEGRHLLVGNFGRYYFPLFPPLILLGVLGLERTGRLLGSRIAVGRLRLPGRALLLGVILVPTVATLVQGAARYAQNVANVHDSDVRMGRWLSEHLHPQAVMAVQDIGAIKFFTPNPVLDLVGLVTPEIQGYIKGSAAAGDPFGELGKLRFLEEKRPDYLVVYPEWDPRITGDTARFPPLVRLEIPDNITMAGDELVVHATPWTRYPLRRGEG
jgi:arabinofuranosyltransferase